MSMTKTGRCLCGAVHFEATLEDESFGACHCAMCRRFSGGILMATTATQVTWSGQPNIQVYESSDWAERGFCRQCGSSLYYRIKGSEDFQIAIGALDDLDGMVLASEIFIDSKPVVYELAGEAEKLSAADVIARHAPPSEPGGS